MMPKLLEQERFFERVETKSQKFRICNPDFHLHRLLVQVALANRQYNALTKHWSLINVYTNYFVFNQRNTPYLDLNMYFLSYMLHILRYLVSRFAEGRRILQYCSISVCKIFCFYLSTHYSCFISQASTKYSVTEFHVVSKNLPCYV